MELGIFIVLGTVVLVINAQIAVEDINVVFTSEAVDSSGYKDQKVA